MILTQNNKGYFRITNKNYDTQQNDNLSDFLEYFNKD
jgi:hypothetical protein